MRGFLKNYLKIIIIDEIKDFVLRKIILVKFRLVCRMVNIVWIDRWEREWLSDNIINVYFYVFMEEFLEENKCIIKICVFIFWNKSYVGKSFR